MSSNATPRWWLLVAVVPFYVVFSLVVHRVVIGTFDTLLHAEGQPLAGLPDAIGLLVAGTFFVSSIIAILGVYLVPPTLPVGMFLDARALRDGDFEWRPNPAFWGGLGTVQLLTWGGSAPGTGVGGSEFVYLFTVPLALVYLLQRRQTVGKP